MPYQSVMTREPVPAALAPSGAVSPIRGNDEPTRRPILGRSKRGTPRDYGRRDTMPMQHQRALTVGQIMCHPVVSARPDMTIAQTRDLFRERRFRHLPVVTISGAIGGIVSDRDVLGVSAERDSDWVVQVMSKRVVTAMVDTSLRDVAKTMTEERIGGLPVVDTEHRLVGIVTRSDLLRCIVNEAPIDLWI